MAPMAVSDLRADLESSTTDPTVFPAPHADDGLKTLWSLHGHPHSTSFSNPDLTSIAALVRHNAVTIPNKPAFVHPSENDHSFEVVDWAKFDALTDAAALRYSINFRDLIDATNKTSKQPTIGLLGNGNTIDYLITQMALLKLNFRVLLLSNKNAPSARDHLLDVCNVGGLIADASNVSDPSLRSSKGYAITPLIPLSELQSAEAQTSDSAHGFITSDPWNLQAMIIHSSGSTGMPKPIIHTNRSLCLIARMYRLFQDFSVENWYESFPLFHIAGLSIILSGLPNGLPTTLPPLNWPPAPSAILDAWNKLEKMGMPADCLHCAPSVIEDLYTYISMTTQDFSPLVNLKVLQPGGAPLSLTLLEKLVNLGVNVKTTYGSTEIGPVMRTIPHNRENPSCYKVRNLYPDSPYVKMESLGDGLFECVVYRGFELAAELWQNDDSPNPYRTNDLFVEEPAGSGFFVLQGRKDDILVHDNGEKTHAGALQMQLEECGAGLIAKTAVFGSGKPCTAVVVEASSQEGDLGQEELSARIWERISKCNQSIAQHSRIDQSMILILDKGETLPVTPKGNVRRKEAWKQYGDRIEALYAKYLSGDDSIADGSVTFDPATNRMFIAEGIAIVCGISAEEIAADTNFYDLGLDSQKAVKLRSMLSKRFGAFPLMFVFEYPTLSQLHAYLTTSKPDGAALNGQGRLDYIRKTVTKLNQEISGWEIEASPESAGKSSGEVVYLTGASGALGNAILENFVRNPGIAKVYCAIRGDDPSDRLVQSLRRRGYPSEVFSSAKLCAIPYDMRSKTLGLSSQLYERLLKDVTVVVHNAWKMDFNQRVEMFEDDCLHGVMSLLEFCCHGTRKTFSFMSSVAACMGPSAKGTRIEEVPVSNDPGMALNTGYAQSKFIVENITQHYARELSMPVRLFRVGQLCAHTRLGVWNGTEMWPIMISTGINHLYAMPELPETTVNWLPVDLCARAISSALMPQTECGSKYAVHNLVNPAKISWDAFLDILAEASACSFERISMRQWIERLEKAAEEGNESIPGLKLLSFFQDMAGESGEEVEFRTDSIGKARPVDAEVLRLCIERWREEGFM